MSMPSSRLLVATTAGRRPDLRSSSMLARCSLLTEPWCARASTAGRRPSSRPEPSRRGRAAALEHLARGALGQISLSRAVRRSASRRELANTMVDRCEATRSTTRSSTCGQIEVRRSSPAAEPSTSPVEAPSEAMSSTGTTTERSTVFCDGGCTTVTGREPPRNVATSSTGRTVAERPMRCAGCSSSASRRSSESARCAPRLVPATACTSSTITVSTPRSASRAPAR